MQAGLTSRQLTWRDVFLAGVLLLLAWMVWLMAVENRARLPVTSANSS